MRWILLIAGVFNFCGGVAISYWRQTNVDVSPTSMILILVLLPSFVVAGVYGIYRFKKSFKERNKIEQESSPDIGKVTLAEGSAEPWMHVYAVTVQTQLGDHADQIILGLQQFRTAECDDELWNINGSKLLSRRIDLVINNPIHDLENSPETIDISSLSARALRIAALTQNVYDALDSTLAAIVEGMSESHLWQLPTPTQQAILHPAWQGKRVTEEKLSEVEQIPAWPKTFKMLYLLPDHLALQDQQYLQQIAAAQMLRYGFHAEQIQWINGITKNADDTFQHIEQVLMEQLTPSESSLLLVIGADSNLDQDFLDSLLHKNSHFIPTEASFSFLISSDVTLIPSLPVLSRMTAPILKRRQKPMSAGGQLGAEALNAGLDELRRLYLITTDLIPESGILVSDINPAKSENLRELSLALRSFDLPAEDLIFSGSLLENTDAMASGVALAIALQQAELSKLHVTTICSTGDILRGLWIAAPYSQMSMHDESLEKSESLNAMPEHA